MTSHLMFPRPDTATLRELAVRYGCDPRSIVNRIEGIPVRGLAGKRADAAANEWRERNSRPLEKRAIGGVRG